MIRSFLVFDKNWKFPLLIVFCSAVGLNIVGFHFILKGSPVISDRFEIPKSKTIDWRLIGGAALFGIGWGIMNYCPGPILVVFPRFIPQVTLGVSSSFLVGRFVGCRIMFINGVKEGYTKEQFADCTPIWTKL